MLRPIFNSNLFCQSLTIDASVWGKRLACLWKHHWLVSPVPLLQHLTLGKLILNDTCICTFEELHQFLHMDFLYNWCYGKYFSSNVNFRRYGNAVYWAKTCGGFLPPILPDIFSTHLKSVNIIFQCETQDWIK